MVVKQALKLIYKKGSMPSNLIYYVTNRCNCKCSHCYFWKNLNQTENELKLEEVEKFSKTIKNLLYLNLTGGEPFLRKDLPKIVEAFYTNSGIKAVVIPTNGILTDIIVEKVKKIAQSCKRLNIVIYVSIDDIGEKHDKIRGFDGVFTKAVETLNALKELKREYKNISIGTLSTFTSINQDRANEIYLYIRNNLKPKVAYFNVVRGDAKNPLVKDIDIAKYRDLCKLIEKDMLQGKLAGYRSQWFWPLSMALNLETHNNVLKTLEKKQYYMPCYAGLLNGVVYSNGDVMPCELVNWKMGNLRDFNYDFRKLWDSSKAKEIRNKIKNKKCFCTHECFMNINILYNPKFFPRILSRCAKLISGI